jgi:hypothetical protein
MVNTDEIDPSVIVARPVNLFQLSIKYRRRSLCKAVGIYLKYLKKIIY